MRLPPTIGDAPLPRPDEPPPEDSEPYEPSEMLEADEGPEELDLLFEELNPEDPEAPVEEIDSLVPEISKMKIEPAEVSAGGEPGNLFKRGKIKLSRVSKINTLELWKPSKKNCQMFQWIPRTVSYRDKFYDFCKNIVKIWKKNWKR